MLCEKDPMKATARRTLDCDARRHSNWPERISPEILSIPQGTRIIQLTECSPVSEVNVLRLKNRGDNLRKFRKSITALSAAAFISLPGAAAGAVTASAVDPTGDGVSGVDDIISLRASLTTSTVSVTVETAAALPATSDPSWAAKDRALFIDMGYGHTMIYDKDGLNITDNRHQVDCGGTLATTNGAELTLSAPATCFSNPGRVDVRAYLITGDDENGTLDAAISNSSNADADVNPVVAGMPGGYYSLGLDGGVFSFGDALFKGSMGGKQLNEPIISMATDPDHDGYWLVAADGGVFNYGASFYGSMGGKDLNEPVIGIAPTPSGHGYWLVASDGGIFNFGDAGFYGSTGSMKLNQPIVGMKPTPSGHGYWLVAADGGIFNYGDADFFGSAGGIKLNSPVVGMTTTSTGDGYILAAADGGVFAYGQADYKGSGVDDFKNFDDEVVGIAGNDDGYYLVGLNGYIFNYGDALDYGDTARLDLDLNAPIIGMAIK